jgi:serine/threonine protein kinase
VLHTTIDANFEETEELAPGGSLLYGQYTIERHLIDGGFGMTYLARDSLDRRVVIKECFPSSFCRRIRGEVRPRKPDLQDQFQGVIRNFLREALRLAKFEHPNIVKVHQVFQENNTAYIAMDFVDGMDLLSMLDLDPGRLTDPLVQKLLRDTLGALDHVHGFGMLHRDVSPDNLLLDDKDNLTLIDFGAAREDLNSPARPLSTMMAVKDGYSPHEFYYTTGTQEPSSDIYSVGATFYHLITGFAPPDCQKRMAALTTDQPDPYKPLADGKWSFDPAFLRAIDKALSVPQQDRFQSAAQWLEVLDRCEGPSLNEPCFEFTASTRPPQSAPALVQPEADAAHNDIPAASSAELPEIEPQLAEVISTMVQTNNSQIDPLNRKKAEEEAARAEAEKTKLAETPRLFDMFGNPIEDVDKWLKEQDKQSRSGSKPKATSKPKEVSAKPHKADTRQMHQETAGFGLARVFSKFSRKRRTTELAQT